MFDPSATYDPTGDLQTALVETGGLPQEAPARPPLTITDHGVQCYFDADPPAQEFLVDGKLAMGSTTVVAAPGGAGKGLLVIDLVLKVASSPAGPFNDTYALGGRVLRHGPAVYLTAEDSRDEIHRRIRANGRKPDLPCYIVPMPSCGGSARSSGSRTTTGWSTMRAEPSPRARSTSSSPPIST